MNKVYFTVSILASLFLYSCSEEKTAKKEIPADIPNIETPKKVESNLEVFSIGTGERKVVYKDAIHFEAPNWSRDGEFLIYNSHGKIYKIPSQGGDPELI